MGTAVGSGDNVATTQAFGAMQGLEQRFWVSLAAVCV